MTNATTIEKNITSHDQINGENCNVTAKTDNKAQICGFNTLPKLNNHCSNNTANNSTNQDCENTRTGTHQEKNTKNDQVLDKNTVLKYVYKKGETEVPSKNNGHFKNSLRRRKRSANELQNKSPLPSKFQKPAVIVNYETSHGPGKVSPLLTLQNTGNTILGANLAEFSIETLHGNSNLKNKKNVAHNPKKDSTEVENLNEDSNESNEREYYKQNHSNNKSSRDSEESGEQKDYKNKNSNREYDDSGEHKDNRKQQVSRVNDASEEHNDYKNIKSNQDDENSGEHGEPYQNKKPSPEDDDSVEREDYRARKSGDQRNDSGEDYKNIKSRRRNDHSGEHEDNKNDESSREGDGSREHNAYRQSESSYERDDSGNHEDSKPIRKRGESGEREDYKDGSADNYNSAESIESAEIIPQTKLGHSSANDNSKESNESTENKKSHPNSAESTESSEINDKIIKPLVESQENIKYAENNKEGRSYNSQHLDSDHNNPRKNVKFSNLQQKIEGSDESYENIEEKSKPKEKDVNYETDHTNQNKKLPVPIRDIDLSDFSFERLHVNDHGKIVPQKDSLEGTDPKTAVEILPLSTATPELTKVVQNSLTSDHTLPNPENETSHNKLIHINDGEVKPVVEINTENDSGSSEENTKPSLSGEVESLESILGVKEPDSLEDNGQSDKIVAVQKDVQNGDVKQQFERIPLNYNHAETNQKKDSKTTEAPNTKDTGVTKIDGTLDVFTPEDVRYDENLNIKFDDLTIKLPEIKLPDDILAYAREGSPYTDEIKTQPKEEVPIYKPSFYYNHDDSEETPRKEKNDDDDDDDHNPDSNYYGYYGDDDKKQNYKKNDAVDENDEEEDLYEKFVRERFGKRGTFEKRSEKLVTAPLDPQLYKTIKNILKKTADIDEQAKRSGDPNAGYMWTLEYGEKM